MSLAHGWPAPAPGLLSILSIRVCRRRASSPWWSSPICRLPGRNPAQGLPQIVKRFLDRRRVVGTRVEVRRSTLPRSVREGLYEPDPTHHAARVETQIRQALNASSTHAAAGPIVSAGRSAVMCIGRDSARDRRYTRRGSCSSYHSTRQEESPYAATSRYARPGFKTQAASDRRHVRNPMASDLDIPFDRITYRRRPTLTALDLRRTSNGATTVCAGCTCATSMTHGVSPSVLKCERPRTTEPSWSDGLRCGRHRAGYLAGRIHTRIGPYHTGFDACGVDHALPGRRRLPRPSRAGGAVPLRRPRPAPRTAAFRLASAGRCAGPEVPLVQVVVEAGVIQGSWMGECGAIRSLSSVSYIGWGETEPGRTGWRQEDNDSRTWRSSSTPRRRDSQRVPYYFATPAGRFRQSEGRLPLQPDVWPTGTQPTFSWEGGISSPTPIGRITLSDHCPPSGYVQASDYASEAESRQWTVAWVGIEPVSGCEPALDFTRLFTLSGFPVRMLASFIGTSGG